LESEVLLEVAAWADELDVGTILDDQLLFFELEVIFLVHVREAPLLRDNNLLATRELVSRTSKGFNNDRSVRLPRSNRKNDLANVNAGYSAIGLAPCTTHTSLQPISTGATQHLVNADDMEGVDANAKVERILARVLSHIFVSANTGRFQSLRGDLFVLVRDEVSAERKVIDAGTLATQVENADLGVWYTTVVPALRVGLVLAVAVAASRSAAHFWIFE